VIDFRDVKTVWVSMGIKGYLIMCLVHLIFMKIDNEDLLASLMTCESRRRCV